MRLLPRRLRLSVRGLVQAAFAALFALSLARPATAGLGMRLDPVAGLSAMLAARRFLLSFWPALGMVVLALVAGRAWCSWLCPLGTLLEWTGPPRIRHPLPRFWNWPKYALLAALLVAACLRFPYLVLLDPLALLTRSAGVLLLASVHTPSATDLTPLFFLGLVLLLNRVSPRFWCRAFCPLGAALALLAHLALFRRRVRDTCNDCGACSRPCPTGVASRNAHPSECLVCLRCASLCPSRAVHWTKAGRAPVTFDPSRRAFLAALGAGTLAGILAPLARLVTPEKPRWLRPPGAKEAQLLAQCLRCGACIAICPTGVLRPLLAGPHALWTPEFVPRRGYCRYTCNACGQACPTGAIPPLPLAEKQRAVIGLAQVDPTRCLTWTENRACTVCHDTCPVPGGAIRLVAEDARTPAGERIRVRRPQVQEERCNGCGICEYNCPVEGEAAIRVRPV